MILAKGHVLSFSNKPLPHPLPIWYSLSLYRQDQGTLYYVYLLRKVNFRNFAMQNNIECCSFGILPLFPSETLRSYV